MILRPTAMGACALSLVLASSASAQVVSEALYEVRFDATWSAATHPGAYPNNNPHFSPLIGASHNSSARLWQPNGLATDGIEVMAETGGTNPLANEITTLIGAGSALDMVNGGAPNAPGMTSAQFLVSADFPLISLVTMIAPSPDWFVGVDSLPRMQNGEWVDLVVELTAWDAGTDSGAGFNSGNQDTNPAEPISLITGGPFTGTDPLGTFTFTRIALGDNFCGPAVPNSSGSPASIFALGSGTAGSPLTLVAQDVPAMRFGLFVVSDVSATTTPMGSNGVLCLGGMIGSYSASNQIALSTTTGRLRLVTETTSLPIGTGASIQAGDTWRFQAWFRDAGGSSNFSDGVSILFQ